MALCLTPRRLDLAAFALCVVSLSASFSCAAATGNTEASALRAAATFWCPMHAEIRGRAGGRCPICGMALVPIGAAGSGGYGLDVEILPRALEAGQQGRVRFLVRQPNTGETVRRFELVHERVFHLFVVSYDLEYFAHVHPTVQPDGALEVELRVPRPGAYQLIADFLPAGGSPQLVQRSFVTAGYGGSLVSTPKVGADTADKVAGATRVKLTMPDAVAGREQLLTFDLEDAATGASVRDLEVYLGAAGHLLIVSTDLAVAEHSHPVAEITSAAGPTVVFQVRFPSAGDYRMWMQFQRVGQVATASFTVPVRPARSSVGGDEVQLRTASRQ